MGTAKENRKSKLKQAKAKAEEDIELFKQEQEAQFKVALTAKAAADPERDQRSKTEARIRQVNQDYETNKARTVKYVVEKVLEVSTILTETQKQALSDKSV